MTDTTIPSPTRSRALWKFFLRALAVIGPIALRVAIFLAILAFNLLVLILWASAWIIMATVDQNQVSGG